MISIIRAKRVLRTTALAVTILFLNLVLSVDLGALSEGGLRLRAAEAQGAATARRVAVFVLPASEDDAQAAQVLNSIIRENTGQLGEVELVTGAKVQGAELLGEAERLIDNGVAQINQRNSQDAETTLARAHGLVEQALPAVPKRLHARVLKALGIAKFLNGKTAEARVLVKKSILVFENQNAAEYAYTLETKDLFREIRREIQDAPTGTLEVVSNRPGAEVYVDHYLKGYTTKDPLSVQNLAAGPHFVRVVLDGFNVWAGFAEVEPAGTEKLSVVLTPTPDSDRVVALLNGLRDALRQQKGVQPALEALRNQVGATEILGLVARQGQDGFELQGTYLPPDGSAVPVEETVAQDTSLFQSLRDLTSLTIGGEYVQQEMLALDSPSGVTTELSVSAETGGAAEQLVLNPDSPIFAGTKRAGPTPVYKEWWFWTVVGVAVGGAAAGLVLLTTSESGGGGGPTGSVRVQLNQF